ncbi:hypothetical protein FHL15_002734 [Xylaria flabelliformis]|uniref:DUF7223 domain-containing protein n=1 Tax=Xylaria flabelliformis TaxID=2512241 RepID=A0A553I8F4_9PEZI|nr:hypothetical protein FHL15_002734 [Xylaria flabelliformis]
MRAQAGFLALFSVPRSVAALYNLPEPPLPRHEGNFGDLFDTIQSDVLRRSTHDASFPLHFAATNQVLFNGNFGDSMLTVKCIECKTSGEVTASAMLPNISDIDITQPDDIFNDSMLGITFNGVGATIDLDLTAASSWEFSIPLLKTESPIGIAGPGFQIGVVFSVDLVLKVSGKVNTEGGFKVAIPDGSTFMIPFDEAKPNVANFNGASASLLPIKVDFPADMTAALQLKVQAGVMLPDLEIIEAKALAGASIAIPEVILKESASSFPSNSCAIPVSAELNINAGVFIDVGADLAGIDIGEFNPTALTTLFAASTSTCLSSAGNTSISESKTSAGNYSASAKPTPHHTSFRPGRPTPKPNPGPSFRPPPFVGPKPTTLVTTVKSPPQGNPSGPGPGVPSSFAVAARSYARRTAYPITLQSLATPITNSAAEAAVTPVREAVSAVSVVSLRPVLS